MELDLYKLLTKKVFYLGFKAIEDRNNCRICNFFDDVTFLQHGICHYLEEASKLIVRENGHIVTLMSPVIESGFSYYEIR